MPEAVTSQKPSGAAIEANANAGAGEEGGRRAGAEGGEATGAAFGYALDCISIRAGAKSQAKRND